MHHLVDLAPERLRLVPACPDELPERVHGDCARMALQDVEVVEHGVLDPQSIEHRSDLLDDLAALRIRHADAETATVRHLMRQ